MNDSIFYDTHIFVKDKNNSNEDIIKFIDTNKYKSLNDFVSYCQELFKNQKDKIIIIFGNFDGTDFVINNQNKSFNECYNYLYNEGVVQQFSLLDNILDEFIQTVEEVSNFTYESNDLENYIFSTEYYQSNFDNVCNDLLERLKKLYYVNTDNSPILFKEQWRDANQVTDGLSRICINIQPYVEQLFKI